MNFQKLIKTQNRLNKKLIESLAPWQKSGLSSSPLSTAVAIVALAEKGFNRYRIQIDSGIKWLSANINNDGGWGDTPCSTSNLSTTLLCWSAMNYADQGSEITKIYVRKAEEYIKITTGDLEPDSIISSILKHYGKDQTFSVPILMLCAISGRLGDKDKCWDKVPQLPFELAVLPGKFYSLLNLNVVSYALPALIAIGLSVYSNKKKRLFSLDIIRRLTVKKVLKKAASIQPPNGGYLEAVPLTGFVAMSLIAAGYKNHEIVTKCTDFLANSIREDGSWPIDTNLDTWVTTLTINNTYPYSEDLYSTEKKEGVFNWLLSQQFKEIHPYTGGKPGGWSWTDLPGGVPDADDTSGAVITLHHLAALDREKAEQAATKGIEWLLEIQNRDGGIPTFCRGWGKLPFDRSCPDITAHALRAIDTWYPSLNMKLRNRADKFIENAGQYLLKNQKENGAWLPLWFGNQWNRNHENPVYGTSQVLLALGNNKYSEIRLKACSYLLTHQNSDGGWGNSETGNSTFEETGLALSALIESGIRGQQIQKGANWIISNIENITPAPIGLYFASLWYYEDLYPFIFTAGALNRMLQFYIEEQSEKKEIKTCLTDL